MSKFPHPYATTAGSGFVVQKVTAAIEEAVIKSDFAQSNAIALGVKPEGLDKALATVVAHTTPVEETIPYFSHPLPVKMPNIGQRGGQVYIVSDARNFTYGGLQRTEVDGFPVDTFAVKNATEFNLMKIRTILSAYWYNGNTADFRFLPKPAMGIYAQWISQNLSRRFSLDGADQMKIAVIAAAFYESLFREGEFTDAEKNKLAGKIAQVTYAQAAMILPILDRLGDMKNIDDLCERIAEIVENERVKDLKSGLLISVITHSYFGTNASEVAAIALEHVPTWITLVFSAFTDRGFKNSPLGKIAELYRGSKGENDFVAQMKQVMHKAMS